MLSIFNKERGIGDVICRTALSHYCGVRNGTLSHYELRPYSCYYSVLRPWVPSPCQSKCVLFGHNTASLCVLLLRFPSLCDSPNNTQMRASHPKETQPPKETCLPKGGTTPKGVQFSILYTAPPTGTTCST